METEEIVFICILGAALLFLIQYLIAREFYEIALAKGYGRKKYLWLPFFLGMIGFLLVIALPDHNKSVPAIKQPAAPKNEERGIPRNADVQRVPQRETQLKNSTEVVPIFSTPEKICCPICGKMQPASRKVCWDCGAKFKESQED